MKEILLTQGKTALVDDADFEYLNQWRWFASKNRNTFYAVRHEPYFENGIRRKKGVSMHRVILELSDPKIQGEHQDGNGLNNQRYNLRPATNSQNQKNRRHKTVGTSKYLGVYWHKKGGMWVARIVIEGKQEYLGCFSHEIQAAIAYNEAAKIHHKEFANINIIPESNLLTSQKSAV